MLIRLNQLIYQVKGVFGIHKVVFRLKIMFFAGHLMPGICSIIVV